MGDKRPMLLTMEQVNDITDRLQGQCMEGLEDVVADMEIDPDKLTMADHEEIDMRVFCCDTCGWWCETHEQKEDFLGNTICEDCHEDSGEEENE